MLLNPFANGLLLLLRELTGEAISVTSIYESTQLTISG